MHDVAKLDAVIDAYARPPRSRAATAREGQTGAGAAGGLGYALQLLGAKFESGAQTVARLTGLPTPARAPTG